MEKQRFLLEAKTRDRSTYLGGSDVAAILGLSKYKSALDVYNAKLLPSEKDEDKFIFRAGRHNESFILDEYCAEFNIVDNIRDCNAYLIDYPYIGCQIDLYSREQDDRIRLADAKMVAITRLNQFGEAGTSDVPADILCQIALQRFVTDAYRVDVPCMFYPQEIRTFTYYENEELETAIFDSLQAFWKNHILKASPPSAINFEDFKKLYPIDNGLTIDVDYNAVKLIEEIKIYKNAESEARKLKEEKEIELKKIFGANQSLKYGGNIIATLRTVERKAFSVKESSSRVLRLM